MVLPDEHGRRGVAPATGTAKPFPYPRILRLLGAGAGSSGWEAAVLADQHPERPLHRGPFPLLTPRTPPRARGGKGDVQAGIGWGARWGLSVVDSAVVFGSRS